MATEALASHHRAHPLEPGLEVARLRTVLQERTNGSVEPGLADAVIDAQRFTLKGSAMANVRSSAKRAEKDGVRVIFRKTR